MNWENIGFGLTPTDYMFVMKTNGDGCFTEGRLTRYKNIDISPSAGIFNYGQVPKNCYIYIYIYENSTVQVFNLLIVNIFVGVNIFCLRIIDKLFNIYVFIHKKLLSSG